MTTQAAIPLKWYVPFATGDASRVEIPVTSSDPTRASQTLGFPPLTMQPPAVGGVPPQGEDFNGAVNQIARIAWWTLNGGGWPFDAVFATNANIGGYPNGAVLQSADFLGQWISTADNNQNNPDTVGTSWVPGFQYGATALTGQTGGTTTLTPLQAAKRSITISGTLGSALVVIFPAWLKDWTITNNTTGAFTLIAKTLSGSGITIPQDGSPTPVAGDGANITQNPQNIANGTQPTHAVAVGQLFGGLKGISRSTSAGSLIVPTGVTTMYVSGTAAGGGGSSGGPSFNGTATCVGGGGGGGGAGQNIIRQPYAVVPGSTISWTMGSAGTGGTTPGGQPNGNPGANGGNLVISGSGFNGGVSVTLTGGAGAAAPSTSTTSATAPGGIGGSGYPSGSYGQDVGNGQASGNGGMGASGPFGGGGGAGRGANGSGTPGANAGGFGGGGGGGGGTYINGTGAGGAGGNGAPCLVMFEW